MATGPEHYRLAEHILDKPRADAMSIARAQVHATLALAAATALNSTGVGEADLGEWTALICEPDDPYDGMTNADVMSADEMAEYDRDAEFHLDAIDEARNMAAAEADNHDDGYDDHDEYDPEDEDGEF